MRTRHLIVAATAALAAGGALAGCGGDRGIGQSVPQDFGVQIPEQADAIVVRARQNLQQACQASGGSAAPSKAVDTLIQVAKRYPHGNFQSGNSSRPLNMQDVLRREARILKQCGATDAAHRLDSAAAQLS